MDHRSERCFEPPTGYFFQGTFRLDRHKALAPRDTQRSVSVSVRPPIWRSVRYPATRSFDFSIAWGTGSARASAISSPPSIDRIPAPGGDAQLRYGSFASIEEGALNLGRVLILLRLPAKERLSFASRRYVPSSRPSARSELSADSGPSQEAFARSATGGRPAPPCNVRRLPRSDRPSRRCEPVRNGPERGVGGRAVALLRHRRACTRRYRPLYARPSECRTGCEQWQRACEAV